ncbi:MAG TPA: glycosyltransferase family 2 protein [Steroidobacteraceae bacterium]|nr:glycosyltransferase family 2 protein [Steroidobacteraceae bacterium]
MVLVFWISVFAIAYPYAIYPALLVLMNRLAGRRAHVGEPSARPSVTLILPVHNESRRIEAKMRNILELDYPADKMQVLVIGDACTDDTLARAQSAGGQGIETFNVLPRGGKASALNAALERARGEILVFTDAAIMLERESLARLVAHFADPAVGAVSGEDYVEGGGSEGLYGRIELLLRREEALAHSIAGASGCFYAQRRALTPPFISGMAPDFLSVLNVVRAGSRALAEPQARGAMTATKSQSAEYTRKARTFLRGITALFGNAGLMNPFRHPTFAFILISHKLMRWLGPLFMIAALAASFTLRAEPIYAFAFYAQLAAYAAAALGLLVPAVAERVGLVRLAGFFVLVNLAALQALLRWLGGERLEVWEPTRRPQ